MTERAEKNPSGVEQTPLYGMAQVRDIVGLVRPAILYFLRLGLVTPTRVVEGGRSVRKFNEQEVEVLRNAQILKEEGVSPREIVGLLGPDSMKSTLLTELEEQIIRMRYGRKIRRTINSVAEDLGLAKQTVQEIKENAVAKLARAYILRQDALPHEPGKSQTWPIET